MKFARVSNFTKFSYRIRGEKRKCSALSLIDTQTRYTRDTRHTHTYIPYSYRLCPLHGLWAAAGWVDVYLVGLCCVPSALEAQRSKTHISCDRKWGKCDIFVCYVYGLIFFLSFCRFLKWKFIMVCTRWAINRFWVQNWARAICIRVHFGTQGLTCVIGDYYQMRFVLKVRRRRRESELFAVWFKAE